MDQLTLLAVIAGVIVFGIGAQTWVSWLEHKRRSRALEIIRLAMEQGKEPPQALYDEAVGRKLSEKPPWTEVVIFTSLAVGFFLAYATLEEGRDRYLVVAVSMAVTAVGCLILAITRSRKATPDDPA